MELQELQGHLELVVALEHQALLVLAVLRVQAARLERQALAGLQGLQERRELVVPVARVAHRELAVRQEALVLAVRVVPQVQVVHRVPRVRREHRGRVVPLVIKE